MSLARVSGCTRAKTSGDVGAYPYKYALCTRASTSRRVYAYNMHARVAAATVTQSNVTTYILYYISLGREKCVRFIIYCVRNILVHV